MRKLKHKFIKLLKTTLIQLLAKLIAILIEYFIN